MPTNTNTTNVAKKPKVKLIGTDGNAFALMGRVRKALNDANLQDQAKDFNEKAFQCESYDALLRLIGNYVEVK